MTDSKSAGELSAPRWPTCGALSSSSTECIGIPADGFDQCLAHLDPEELDEAMDLLEPGVDLDARGTTLSESLLSRITDAVRDDTGRPRFGRVWFSEAVFTGLADFSDCLFTGYAVFGSTTFSTEAWFGRAMFSGAAVFSATAFTGVASFADVNFTGEAHFDGARFTEAAWFTDVVFSSSAMFHGASFTGPAWFNDVTFAAGVDLQRTRFTERASFRGARFQVEEHLGPLYAGKLWLAGAVFEEQVTIEALCPELDGVATHFKAGVTLRLLHATVNLERAVFGAPSAVVAAQRPFTNGSTSDFWTLDVTGGHDPVPALTSLVGVDVIDLVLTDVNLEQCRFAGSHHLDKLRLEGDCRFGAPPTRLWLGPTWPLMWWWTRRQVLAEEQVWRAYSSKEEGWPAPYDPDVTPPELAPRPLPRRQLADLYRKLRKAQEDSKNEPGASDFYYGEMEMRRNDSTAPMGERVILHLYWMVSGYGLRALRALSCLAVLTAVVALAFHWYGFVDAQPSLGICVLYVAQSVVSLETKLASLPTLTWHGEVLRLLMRLLGPLLLGLALLAIRNRVKR